MLLPEVDQRVALDEHAILLRLLRLDGRLLDGRLLYRLRLTLRRIVQVLTQLRVGLFALLLELVRDMQLRDALIAYLVRKPVVLPYLPGQKRT